ncbi:MAG TPA: CoA transferase [Ilumatobacter sp.]|nr:CoA transferase [Ilumatobacter sp.]
MRTPLDGIRVLDFTRVLAGPHCTRMLADLGAEVIKVEPPDADLTRFQSPRRNGIATYFAQQNTGKRCISIDLATAEGSELALRLAERCDVVVENFRPGVMARLGLSYETLSARNPAIILCSISGYGQTGPWRSRRAYASVVQAESGITESQSTAFGQYRNDRHSHADAYTGMEAATAITAALFQRSRTGTGQHVDVSMADTMLYANEHTHDDLWEGDVDPNWIRSFGNDKHQIVTVGDGSRAVIAGHPAQPGTFERVVDCIGRADLAADPRLATPAGRLEHFDLITDAVSAYAATVPDVETLEAAFGRYALAVGAIRSVADLANSEWAAERGSIVDVDDRGGGTFRIPNSPWRFSDAADVGVRGAVKYRGEDNAAVLRELLGSTDEEIDRWEADGVLSQHMPGGRADRGG